MVGKYTDPELIEELHIKVIISNDNHSHYGDDEKFQCRRASAAELDCYAAQHKIFESVRLIRNLQHLLFQV